MTTVNNTLPTGYTTPLAAVEVSKPATTGVSNLAPEVIQGSLIGSGPAGELTYNMADVNGIDWTALTNDLAASASLSVSMTQVMTLLIQVMSQMRQDQRQATLADAQSALQSGLAAAEKSKQAALMQLISTSVNSSLSMAAATTTLARSAKSDLSMSENAYAKYTGETRAYSEMIQGLGNLAGGGLSYAGSMAQAESKQDDAQASYESSRQQADQSFFDQLGQSIKTLLDSWKATESVTHQANSQIYNI